MKQRSLVRIPPPPLVWTCHKKKKIETNFLREETFWVLTALVLFL